MTNPTLVTRCSSTGDGLLYSFCCVIQIAASSAIRHSIAV